MLWLEGIARKVQLKERKESEIEIREKVRCFKDSPTYSWKFINFLTCKTKQYITLRYTKTVMIQNQWKLKWNANNESQNLFVKGLLVDSKQFLRIQKKTSIISYETLYIIYSVDNICQMIFRLQQKVRHITVYAFVD